MTIDGLYSRFDVKQNNVRTADTAHPGFLIQTGQVRSKGYEPRATPLDEFVKAGGSAKCLTLRLDGEEAAGWKKATG